MAMLPTLPTQKTIMVNQMCRHILPGNVAETCFPVQERNEGNFFYNCSFCRSSQPRSWSSLSAPYFSFLAARTSAVWSWPALPKLYQIGRSFSFQIDIPETKRRITMHPYGRFNRNPSKFINEYSCFLNVRMQCNIRGRESQ